DPVADGDCRPDHACAADCDLRSADRARAEKAARSQDLSRIVCLVPSITELLCELGLAGQIVGRTGFCIHPRATVRRIPKVGGTKAVDIEKVRALKPTHVIVNVDENEKPTADAISEFVPHLVVTHPLAPLDNLALYRQMGEVFGVQTRAEELCAEFQAAYDAATARTYR